MNIDDHISAIKGHLKAIEAERQPKQPKKEPKRYLVLPVEADSCHSVLSQIREMASQEVLGTKIDGNYTRRYANAQLACLSKLILSGIIITVNEE